MLADRQTDRQTDRRDRQTRSSQYFVKIVTVYPDQGKKA